MTGNAAGVDGLEVGGGWDLFQASQEDLLIKAELRLLLCKVETCRLDCLYCRSLFLLHSPLMLRSPQNKKGVEGKVSPVL